MIGTYNSRNSLWGRTRYWLKFTHSYTLQYAFATPYTLITQTRKGSLPLSLTHTQPHDLSLTIILALPQTRRIVSYVWVNLREEEEQLIFKWKIIPLHLKAHHRDQWIDANAPISMLYTPTGTGWRWQEGDWRKGSSHFFRNRKQRKKKIEWMFRHK